MMFHRASNQPMTKTTCLHEIIANEDAGGHEPRRSLPEHSRGGGGACDQQQQSEPSKCFAHSRHLVTSVQFALRSDVHPQTKFSQPMFGFVRGFMVKTDWKIWSKIWDGALADHRYCNRELPSRGCPDIDRTIYQKTRAVQAEQSNTY
eukprot:1161501-Pelagomonas_calceolata.AAC.3